MSMKGQQAAPATYTAAITYRSMFSGRRAIQQEAAQHRRNEPGQVSERVHGSRNGARKFSADVPMQECHATGTTRSLAKLAMPIASIPAKEH